MKSFIRIPTAFASRLAIVDEFFYDHRERLTRVLHRAMILTGLLAAVSLVAEFGFYLSPSWRSAIHVINAIVVWGFIANSAAQFLIAQNRKEHAKSRWFELVLTGALLLGYFTTIPFVGSELFKRLLNAVTGALEVEPARITSVYIAITQVYIFANLVLGGLRYSHRTLQRRFRPVNAVVISFVAAILVGALGLMLPAASVSPGSMPFTDALFTSASAVCVTGLVVVDTATYYTMFGQTLIMALIQVGGLGLMTLTMFFIIFMESSASLRQQAYMRDVLNDATVTSARQTLRSIMLFTLVIELAGGLVFYLWLPQDTIIDRPRWFYALFHSVSAFCNAGFALWTPNLAGKTLAFSLPLNLNVMLLIVFGGLGFTVLRESVDQTKAVMRGRLPRFSVQAQLVFLITAILIAGGAAAYYALERTATLNGLTTGQRVLSSFFQSVTCRTAGFNTLDTTKIVAPTALMMILLMGIGGSPGGTAGGVKTTTVGIAFLSAFATARGKDRIEILHRRIPEETVVRAMTALVFAAAVTGLSTFLLALTEPDAELTRLLFEEVSAFGTVGLSMGVTPGLSAAGKYIIIVSMFLGRVGPLTIAIALSQRKPAGKFQYPSEDVMVM